MSFEERRLEGRACMLAGNYQGAIRSYNGCLSLKCSAEDKAKILSNLSMAHLRIGMYSKAAKDAKACIELWPNWEKGYYRMAEVYRHMGDYETAGQIYAHALQFDPENTDLDQKMRTCSQLIGIQKRLQNEVLWHWAAAGAGIGLVLGIMICSQSTAGNVVEKMLSVVAFAALGALVGFGCQMLLRMKNQQLVRCPAQLIHEQKQQLADDAPDFVDASAAESSTWAIGRGGGAPTGSRGGRGQGSKTVRKRTTNASKRNRTPNTKGRRPPTVS